MNLITCYRRLKIISDKLQRIVALVCLLTIKLYQNYISPMFPPTCRFTPTCSSYALQAFRKYPFYYAFYLSLKRILRCNPLFPGGYDPLK